MNRAEQVIKLHLRNKLTWFYVPWIILAANFLINMIIASSLNLGETMHTGAISSIFVYTFVIGTITLKETFPFAVGLSIRRKDYFFGTVWTALIINGLSALILTVLSVIEGATNGWGVRLNLFKVAFLSDVSVISTLGIYLILLLNMYFLGFAISSIHRRFGRTGLYIFFTTLLLIGTLVSLYLTHFSLWGDLILGGIAHHYLELFWWMVPVTAVYLAAAYGLLRRASV
ncbi:hypothetical protein BC351_20660 [Paenibacillus ferrarius]|uniref:Uncharacterized protein n=1 Tax=Paenibacillus ferrarius TaxID=1469647 RepID=A0A1V4HNF5_9BACL|nr:hypothetical protein [Paenibacillus ferrarius]OPH59323.1 hypothetical protein BC351_20660 [Paenibacillus ferrarius]